jgi:hypothetical protein
MSKRFAAVLLVLTSLALLCWLLMFLAGTDVWQDTGRLDIWRLDGPPYAYDLRAFVMVFYALLPVLIAQFCVAVAGVLRQRGPKPA